MDIAWIPGLTPGMTEVCGAWVKERIAKIIKWLPEGENWWLSLAIFLTLLAVVTNLIFLYWISAANAQLNTVEKLDVIKIVGSALLAGITFATVVWRGLVSARQADEQRRANNSKDEENTARLMFDGAKLIGEANEASIVAGIAGLEVVIKTPNSPFSVTAMNVLGDFIIYHIDAIDRLALVEQARIAMAQGASRELFAQRSLRVDQSSRAVASQFKIFNDFDVVEYFGGQLSSATYEAIRAEQSTKFHNCTLSLLPGLEIDERFTDCTFISCSFNKITMDDQETHTFSNCDFTKSEVIFTDPLPAEELDNLEERYYKCFFVHHPPRGEQVQDILHLLSERDPDGT